MATDKFITLEELNTTTQALLSKINEQSNLKVDKVNVINNFNSGTKIGTIDGKDFYTPSIESTLSNYVPAETGTGVFGDSYIGTYIHHTNNIINIGYTDSLASSAHIEIDNSNLIIHGGTTSNRVYIYGLVDPWSDTDAANKKYVDNNKVINGHSATAQYGYILAKAGTSTTATLIASQSCNALALWAGTTSNSAKLQIGLSSGAGIMGQLALGNSTTSNKGFTTIIPSATYGITIKLPSSEGTLALTSDIKTVTASSVDYMTGYPLIRSNVNTGAVTTVSLAKAFYLEANTTTGAQVLQIGRSHSTEGFQGQLRLANNSITAQYTTIIPSATTNAIIKLPASAGTLALETHKHTSIETYVGNLDVILSTAVTSTTGTYMLYDDSYVRHLITIKPAGIELSTRKQSGQNAKVLTVSDGQILGLENPTTATMAANKAYVDNAISSAIGNVNAFNISVVQSLPSSNIDDHTIYFISNSGDTGNIYDEYMYINSNWEKLGTTEIDLSKYWATHTISVDYDSTNDEYTFFESLDSINGTNLTLEDVYNYLEEDFENVILAYGTEIFYLSGATSNGAYIFTSPISHDKIYLDDDNFRYEAYVGLSQPDWLSTTGNSVILNKPAIIASATGTNAIIEGDLTNNIAIGNYSHAEGYHSQANRYYTHAEGYMTIASATAAHAEGNSTTASGSQSHTEGYYTTASGSNSHAEGKSTTASGNSSHAEGDTTRATAAASHAEGLSTFASGSMAHTEGSSTKATATASHAEGYMTQASGFGAHAEGRNTTANGWSSHTEGYKTIASATAAHAEGYYATATGFAAHAEGMQVIASVTAAHAEGYNTQAIGMAAHAEGNSTTASGNYSHTEGNWTEASGNYSHAEGNSTLASGNCSHAEGSLTIANSESQHVFGAWNIADSNIYTATRGNYIEIVGNGTSQVNRSNARTLDWNGNEWLAGTLIVGAAPTTAMHVATKKYVDDIIINKISMPASATNGDFLVYNGSTWVAQSLSVWNGGNY